MALAVDVNIAAAATSIVLLVVVFDLLSDINTFAMAVLVRPWGVRTATHRSHWKFHIALVGVARRSASQSIALAHAAAVSTSICFAAVASGECRYDPDDEWLQCWERSAHDAQIHLN